MILAESYGFQGPTPSESTWSLEALKEAPQRVKARRPPFPHPCPSATTTPVRSSAAASTADAEPLFTRHFWTASASHFLLGMGFWMFVVFPLHLAELGASTARI